MKNYIVTVEINDVITKEQYYRLVEAIVKGGYND